MSLLKRTTSKNPVWAIFFLFVLLHFALFNINAVEWGDSYRILRAAEELKIGAYPEDEKRPPLFSLVLSLRPPSIDPVFWGRGIMLLVSVASFAIFYLLVSRFIKENSHKNLALLLFTFNPVFLYWSLRIMSDVPFTLLVLISLYLLTVWRQKFKWTHATSLGLLAGLSVLTRFEGYLLFGSLGLGILLVNFSDLKKLFLTLRKRFVLVISYLSGFLTLWVPYIMWRNPFKSSYFEEPSKRVYDLKMVMIYVVSLLFIFGFTAAFGFIFNNKKRVVAFLEENVGITTFVVSGLLLVLLWPAAIPRIFVPVIPLLIILLVLSIGKWFEKPSKKFAIHQLILFSLLLGLYVLSQFTLRLQFLILTRKLILLIFLLQLPSIFFTLVRKYKLFVISTCFSAFVWSLLIIFLHKNILISVKSAAEYASENLAGTVAYNDITSVSGWYLDYVGDNTKGFYYDFDAFGGLTYEALLERNIDYLIITNEHNLDMEIDLDKRPYLRVLKEFRYNVNGGEFVSKVVKFEGDDI